MKIGDDYRLETDGRNSVVLLRRREVKKGGERWRAAGYYGDYKAALRAIVQLGILETPAEFQAIIEKLDKIDSMIAALPDNVIQL